MLSFKKFFRLLKHDILSCYKVFVFSSIAILASFSLLGLYLRFQTEVSIMASLAAIIIYFGIMISSISSLTAAVSFINRKMFSKEAYLTLTLPFTTKVNLLSKFITLFLMFGLYALSTVIGASLFVLISGLLNTIPLEEFTNLFGKFNIDTVMNLLSGFFSLVFFIVLGLTCLSVGNTKRFKNHSTIWGGVFFMVISFIFGLAYIFLLGFTAKIELIWITLIISVLSLALAIGGFFLSSYLIDHKVDID